MLAPQSNAQKYNRTYVLHTKPSLGEELPSVGLDSASSLTLFTCEQVVPPAGWKPPSAIDSQQFRFRTRIQAVNELQHTVDHAAVSESFSREYHAWLRSQGKPIKRPPQLAGEELDLAKLHRIVSRRGGFDRVCEDKLWKEVARIMQVGSTLAEQAACCLRSASYILDKFFYWNVMYALSLVSTPSQACCWNC